MPGGFGERGIEGKIQAVRYAREQQHPVSRHLPRHAGRGRRVRAPRRSACRARNSTEFNRAAPHPVIALITEWQDRERRRRAAQREVRHGRHDAPRRAGSAAVARLARAPDLRHGRRSTSATATATSSTTAICEQLTNAGLRFSGFSSDGLVEMIELPTHPWFVAMQFHPEFTLDAARRPSAVHRLRARGARAPRSEQLPVRRRRAHEARAISRSASTGRSS